MHPGVADVAGALTPVPGGVGPLTIAMLLEEHRRGSPVAPAGRVSHAACGADRRHRNGKSFCLGLFGSLGVPIIDADILSRAAVAPGSPALAAVASRFGAAVLMPDGTLDRAALGRIVFSDRAARADLEAIVHPEVYRRISEWFVTLPTATRLAIADIPLLFETGHEHDFDRIVVCACDPAGAAAPRDGPRSA